MGWRPGCYIPSFVEIGPPLPEKKILKGSTIYGRGGHLGQMTSIMSSDFLSFFLSILSRSNFDHHLRCGGWLNFEFSKREKHSGWAIKTFYKKLCRGMLKHIPLYQ